MRKKRKTIVIGIDGGSWNYIEPMMTAGKLPNLSFLAERGVRGVLHSTTPPFSPVAWSSFITGKYPSKHGIFDWNARAEGGHRFRRLSSNDRKATSFWRYLNNEGLKAGIANIPLTYPAEEIDGFLISGIDSPDGCPKKVYPPELNGWINERYGAGMLNVPAFDLVKTREGRSDFCRDYRDHDNAVTEMYMELIDRYGLSVFAANYMINDHFNHLMKEDAYIEEGLRIIDGNIGKFVAGHPDANFIIMSDHGSLRTVKTFYIIDWLKERKYLVFNEKKLRSLKLNSLLKKVLSKKTNLTGLGEKVLRNALVAPLRMAPRGILQTMTKMFGGEESIFYWPHLAIDHARSGITYCSAGSLGIYLNVKPDHPLEMACGERDYDDIRHALIKELSSIKDPDTGRPLFKSIHKKEELYSGQYSHKAPDLVLEFLSPYNIWTSGIVQKTGENPFWDNDEVVYYGRHINEGIFIFYGEDFDSACGVKELNIVDIPAIVLHLNGVAIPNDFDGAVKKELFRSSSPGFNAIRYQQEVKRAVNHGADDPDESSDDAIRKKLSDLGYM